MKLFQQIPPTYAGILIYPVLALAFSWFLTRICILFLPKLGYVRQPGGRHIHTSPIPRGGGLAVIIAFFTVNAAFLLGTDVAGGQEYFIRFLVPAIPLVILGLLDDRWELPAWVKLAVHLAVVVLIWNHSRPEYTFLQWKAPWFVSLGLTALWVIVIINAFNLIDGLDGLASGLGVISCGGMAAWFVLIGGHAMEVVTIAIMAGALLGFLRYNFNPARIFLGDTGSTFLGLFFAILSLSTLDRVVTFTSLLLPLLAIGVPIFDVFLAVWRRSARKLEDNHAGGIMTGDKDHLHHRILRTTSGQKATAVRLYLIGCTFSVMAIIVLLLRQSAPAIGYLILMIALVIALRQFASIELWDSARLIRNGFRKPRTALCLHMAQPFYDFLAIAISFMVTAILILGFYQDSMLFMCCFAPLAVILSLSKVYHVYWLRAGLGNYWRLALTVCLGSWVSCLIAWGALGDRLINTYQLKNRDMLAAAFLFILLNVCLICFERFFIHYAEGYLYRRLFFMFQQQSRKQLRRILIYGGGLNCRFFANQLYNTNSESGGETIVGILDDNPALHGLIVHGFPVLGALDRLEAIQRQRAIAKIVITMHRIPADRLEILKDFCARHQVELTTFGTTEINLLPQVPAAAP
ncbi:MAG: hypothetical protein PHC30_07575 [Lentisphaeria bacterium]|jgi:UDP-N-acetylmuramyl pentapeptide phosphotransferase/UDP-N-acetylglucosamine-1-phosphate transferase|nr:hypothetical protein [Lentisphaeria bacterium]